MPREFCIRLTAKIRRLGYAPHEAEHLTAFLITRMVLVGAVMGVLRVPGLAVWEWIDRLDTSAAEPFDVTVLPAAYGIQR